MDRFSRRDTASSSSSATLMRNSDCDFDDVFGGPPRRSSSIHEVPYSSGSSVNSGYVDSCSSRMSDSNEKAVFGDQSLNRVDFFDDIFRGDESRRSRRISVGDRLCSDHFGAPITTAQFSLGADLNKSTDLFPSRFSSQSVKVAGGSLLSKSARTEFGRNSKQDPKSPEAPNPINISSNPFQFSKYNWSSRRVSLDQPGRKPKETIKFEKCSSSNNGRIGNGTKESITVVTEDRRKKMTESKNAKKVDEENNYSNKPEVEGMIEKFVKILDLEASLKCVTNVKSQNQSCRWEGTALHKASLNKSSIDIKTEVEENIVEEPLFDSTMDDPVQVEFLIDELPNGDYSFLKPDDHHEAIQVSDAKIREWSNGRQGNIRSLLSTLQYVLWEESGWKPVALVDIIEASSVKKAYQKALLCLHPDKLQQKGAASHKKYIAQVVFDTLQEAWDHFNSIAPL